jgi:hypothetical protein
MRFRTRENAYAVMFVSWRRPAHGIPIKYVVEGKGINGIFDSKAFEILAEADSYFDAYGW